MIQITAKGKITRTLSGTNAYVLCVEDKGVKDDLHMNLKSTKPLKINDKVLVKGSLEHISIYKEVRGCLEGSLGQSLIKDSRELFLLSKTVEILSRDKRSRDSEHESIEEVEEIIW